MSAFVRRLAVNLIPNGYWFYVSGSIPVDKDPLTVDAKFIEMHDLNQSKHARYRRRLAGQASVAYVRYEQEFILLATHGEHAFFEREAGQILDLRRRPVRFHGYSISYRNGHASVRIHTTEYTRLQRYLDKQSVDWSDLKLQHALDSLGFDPYAPVRQQLAGLKRRIQRRRWACRPRLDNCRDLDY
ncbi:MAG TPA: hypothetical protein PLD59_03785 [Tepidisphaeraceae bacterium]|nr:hypothetical protein [Tepidisphaeraceae bacterium]